MKYDEAKNLIVKAIREAVGGENIISRHELCSPYEASEIMAEALGYKVVMGLAYNSVVFALKDQGGETVAEWEIGD